MIVKCIAAVLRMFSLTHLLVHSLTHLIVGHRFIRQISSETNLVEQRKNENEEKEQSKRDHWIQQAAVDLKAFSFVIEVKLGIEIDSILESNDSTKPLDRNATND